MINADLNGSYNILRIAVPNAYADGIEGLGVIPSRITPGKVGLYIDEYLSINLRNKDESLKATSF